MQYRLQQWIFLGIIAMVISGCSVTSPSIRIFTNDFPKVGHRAAPQRVQGTACGSQSLMWFRITSAPKIYDAIQNALTGAGSNYNALSEVKVYEQMHTNILYTYYCFVVEGLPVRYGQAAVPENYKSVRESNPKEARDSPWNF